MKKPVVAITRPADRAKKACEIVEKLGGSAVLAPTLDLKPVNTDSLKDLVKNKDSLDWIVFTSPTTIDSFNLFYPDFFNDLNCKFAVIGNKTGSLLKKQGIEVDLMPDDFTAEGLVEEFTKLDIRKKTIGIPRTASARATLPEGLKNLDNKVIVAEAYKSLFPMDEKSVKDLIAKIENSEIDAITFTSPLTVHNFFKISEDNEKLVNLLSDKLLTVAIGPITGNILDDYKVKYIYPDTYTVPDMMELLFKVWRDSNGR
ncbi:MAG: uroporphyrinogen-III synthase [Methanobrevibacter millerae]|uniref:Uroporphyrinogen-III synthase n=1 Tax=Methanobrevibacter millerae TaxID=230361 RepID=A0A8T3V981_9EURY|nr:uroporphyrinogen-III synthase [Methanobrevibacter millerae]MBE6504297.1 uroporphyrinogen-III synthase [Methanobrevibacter millerae]